MANLSNFTLACNKLNAEIYVVNMIVGSYMSGSNKTPRCIKKFKIDYSLMKIKQQEDAEAEIINAMENLGVDTLNKISNLKYWIEIEELKGKILVNFKTGFEEIVCIIDKKGNFKGLKLITKPLVYVKRNKTRVKCA